MSRGRSTPSCSLLLVSGGRDCPTLTGVTHHWYLLDMGTSFQLAEQMCLALLQILSNPFIFGFIMHDGREVG